MSRRLTSRKSNRRFSSLATPEIYSLLCLERRGGGSIVSTGMRNTSETESTSKPITSPVTSMTMMRVSLSFSRDSSPNRLRNRRRYHFPAQIDNAFDELRELGTRVIPSIRMISCTLRISRPYSSLPSRKLTNCKSRPLDGPLNA